MNERAWLESGLELLLWGLGPHASTCYAAFGSSLTPSLSAPRSLVSGNLSHCTNRCPPSYCFPSMAFACVREGLVGCSPHDILGKEWLALPAVRPPETLTTSYFDFLYSGSDPSR